MPLQKRYAILLLAVLLWPGGLAFQPTPTRALTIVCVPSCGFSETFRVENTNDSYTGYQMAQNEFLFVNNTTDAPVVANISADFLSDQVVAPSPVIAVALNDSLGRTCQVLGAQGTAGIEYGNPTLKANLPPHTKYFLELRLLSDARVFTHDGPFVLSTSVNETTQIREVITLSFPAGFTLLENSVGGTTSQNPNGETTIVWVAEPHQTISISAKFLPFSSPYHDLATWTAFILPRVTKVVENVSQIYPSAGNAEISYFIVGDIPQTINGEKFNPSIPVDIPLPGLGEVVAVNSVSDQNESLTPIYTPTDDKIGTYYWDRSANQITAYPKPIPVGGYYEYQVKAEYTSGIRGGTIYFGAYSAKGTIFVIPKTNGYVAPNNHMNFTLTVLMPQGTWPNPVTTTGYTHTVVDGRWQLMWQGTVGPSFAGTVYYVGYQISDVLYALVASAVGVALSVVGLVASVKVKRGDILIPIIFSAAFVVSQGIENPLLVQNLFEWGAFSWEIWGLTLMSLALLASSFYVALRHKH